MAETLGTRDVLEQMDTRLKNVEQDIRELRSEMNNRFDRLQTSVDQRFMWMYGLLVVVLLGVAGLWFK